MENKILKPSLATKWADHGYKYTHVEDKRLSTDLCMLCDIKSELLLSCESCQSKLCENCMRIIEECDNIMIVDIIINRKNVLVVQVKF